MNSRTYYQKILAFQHILKSRVCEVVDVWDCNKKNDDGTPKLNKITVSNVLFLISSFSRRYATPREDLFSVFDRFYSAGFGFFEDDIKTHIAYTERVSESYTSVSLVNLQTDQLDQKIRDLIDQSVLAYIKSDNLYGLNPRCGNDYWNMIQFIQNFYSWRFGLTLRNSDSRFISADEFRKDFII